MPTADSPANRTLRVGLLWHSATSGNLGVGALTVANLAIARDVAAKCGLTPEFTLLGMRDGAVAPYIGDDVTRHDIDFRMLLAPGGFRRVVRGLDIVLDIGLGDSFAEIYGPKRFAMLWLSKMIVLDLGIPLIFSPQTIGPFTRQPYKMLARQVMERAAAVVARDDRSLDAARDLAPTARLALAADVAFGLPFKDRSAKRGVKRTRIGVNVSGLLFRQAVTARNRFGLSYDYAQFTRELLSDLTARDDVEVHLVAHVIDRANDEDDDAKLADEMAKEFPGTVRAPDFAAPSEAKSYISGLDLLVAARMHACIAAFSSLTPVVPVCYSRKFEGLFGMLGYRRLVPITGIDEAGAYAIVQTALTERATIGAELVAGMARATEKLDAYRGELQRAFTAAAVASPRLPT